METAAQDTFKRVVLGEFQDVTVTSRQYSFGTVSLFPNEKQFGVFQGEEKAKQTTYNPLSVLNNERREKLTL